jgi:5-methylcytosine-specific restriction enzyme A
MTGPRGLERQEFTAKTKGLALKRDMRNGKIYCGNCGIELNPRNGMHFDHRDPDGLGGKPTLENCWILCFTCHDLKTVTEDRPRMSKADRVFKSHMGIKRRKGPPMPGSRASKIKFKIGGGGEDRNKSK